MTTPKHRKEHENYLQDLEKAKAKRAAKKDRSESERCPK
jgi:hypothetical protein